MCQDPPLLWMFQQRHDMMKAVFRTIKLAAEEAEKERCYEGAGHGGGNENRGGEKRKQEIT